MLLKDLLQNIYSQTIPEEFQGINISSICSDSRKVERGCAFFALQGAAEHGMKFINHAIEQGAAVVISEHSFEAEGVCVLTVADAHQFLKDVLLRFYADPSSKIDTVGITGTNGKTTITYLLESIFASAGKTPGVIGTVNHRYGRKVFKANNTTPGLIDNYQYLTEMIEKNIDYCMMEVSSHALVQKRVDGINFKVGVFTNLTSDHLDYHNSQEEYFLAKALMFQDLSPESTAVINGDDPFAQRLVSMTKANVLTYGIHQPADIMAENIEMKINGSSFLFKTPEGCQKIETHLVGQHNIYNILAAAGVALNLGVALEAIKEGVLQLKNVPGRLESIDGHQDFSVFVDYAHTEDALKNVLVSLKKVSDAKIILVFGCGGDRDQGKRPKMGRVASDLADIVIVTNDNPRSEDPQSIVDQIITGFKRDNYRVILDRKQAIQEGLKLAQTGDVVLIAGKGHEDYQIFKNETIDFDERQVVLECLQEGRG